MLCVQKRHVDSSAQVQQVSALSLALANHAIEVVYHTLKDMPELLSTYPKEASSPIFIPILLLSGPVSKAQMYLYKV